MSFSKKNTPRVPHLTAWDPWPAWAAFFLLKWDTTPAWRRGPGPPTGSGNARPGDACAKIYLAKKIAPAELRTRDLYLASNQCYH
jgi:hypothetical protein